MSYGIISSLIQGVTNPWRNSGVEQKKYWSYHSQKLSGFNEIYNPKDLGSSANPSIGNMKKTTPKHIIIKLFETAIGEKTFIQQDGGTEMEVSRFIVENNAGKNQWNDIFKVLEGRKNLLTYNSIFNKDNLSKMKAKYRLFQIHKS